MRTIAGLLAVMLVVGPAEAAAAEVQVGVAREQFDLPRWVPLAGYSRRKGRPSAGAHDAVGVRALVVQDGTTTAALVSGDLLIVDERLFETVRRRLLDEGFPSNIVLILAATHTHSGPGGYGRRFFEKLSMGHFDPDVFNAIVEAVVRAAVRARQGMSAARLAYGTAETSRLAVNRIDPDGVVDDVLTVGAFYRRESGRPFAVLVNFSAHPTTLGSWNMELSADYPGVMVGEIERQIPEAVALFFAGSVGDQGPVKSGEGFEPAARIGRELARETVDLLARLKPATPQAVRAAQASVPLPPALVRVGPLMLPRWLGRLLVDDDATLSVVTVGEVAFLGVPCDLTVSLGQRLKASAQQRGLDPMVIGFASDYIGYCIPETLYARPVYERSLAFNGPKAGEQVVNELIRLMDEVIPLAGSTR